MRIDNSLSNEFGRASGKCYGSILELNLRRNMFLVGDIFMRKYYSIFDRDHDRVGLARSVEMTKRR